MRAESRTAERELARLASRSHGVVTRRQLYAAGVTRAEVASRVRTGGLIRVHPGVYRVGHRAPSVEATYLAAVWACGDGALLSGRAAAYLWGLIKGPAPPPEVTAPTERKLAARRSARICREEAGRCRGIPVTTVPWTLVDLARHDDLARACHEAGVKYKITPRHVNHALARQPNAPGAAHLRSVLLGDTRVTLSKLEHEFLRQLELASLPLPITNRPAGGRRVDCRWPEHHLTVELDSYTFHNSRHAWEQDHRREREARARGDDFRRFTHDDVFERWPAVEAEIRAGCSRACASAPARAS